VLFLPLVMLSFVGIIGWAMENVANPSPMLGVIAYFANLPDAPQPPPSTTHLWFLYNLCQFYLVYALAQRSGLLAMRWTRLLTTPWFVVFVLPLLMVPALASLAAPHPAPEQFMPQAWSFGFFGLFFLVGTQVFRRMEVIDELKAWAPWLLVLSLGLYAVLYTFLPKSLSMEQAMAMAGRVPYSPRQLLMGALEAYIAVHMTIVCLVAGKAFLDRPSRVNRFIADSSYWVYIIHLPVLWLIQFRLLDTPWNAWVEFAISSLGTLAIGAVTYVLFVRYTPIGWLLNGRKKRVRPPRVEGVATPGEIPRG
jgi:peptidoglycan/LPS O-acetylase OafA/YrhL